MGEPQSNSFDVIIIGAGISGINAAFRLQQMLPSASYTILEARDAIGGTWDLFKYPGFRSDSDLYTFGFPWRPWPVKKSIAEGDLILEYMKESAAEYEIDKKVRLKHRVEQVDWRSEEKKWRLDVTVTAGEKEQTETFQSKWIVFCTGYYDYKTPLQTEIPGISNFGGQVIHPQFWPKSLDYTSKSVCIIGSGATAITILPVMAQTASHVTMLQRSPSYIIPQPREDALEIFIRRWAPVKWVNKLIRWKWLFIPWLFRQYCRYFPISAKSFFRSITKRMLPKDVEYSPDFEPKYFPWEQRMCFCPDADFYRAMKKGQASVVTGVIQDISKDTIKLTDGRELHPDIIITATGLKMQLAGGTKICIDGQEHTTGGKHIWKNVMFEGVPNLAYMIGYVDASWTLGCDSAIQLVIRIMKKMEKDGKSMILPKVPTGTPMKKLQYLNLSSTYVAKAKDVLPVAGDQPQWKGRMSYFKDIWEAWYGDIKTGVVYS